MAEWFVSTHGLPTGNGSISNPWDMETALAGGRGNITPGDTVFFRQGVYEPRKRINCTLQGDGSNHIVCRPFEKEAVVIDLITNGPHYQFVILGKDTQWRNINWTNSGQQSRIAGDITRGTVRVEGDGIQIINCIFDNLRVGMSWWMPAEGGLVYGCIFINNGWEEPSGKRRGHGLYLQNTNVAPKFVRNNVIVSNFSYGLHGFGSGNAHIFNIHAIENVMHGNFAQSLIGGGRPHDNCSFIGNQVMGNVADFDYGGVRAINMEVMNNYFYNTEIRLLRRLTGEFNCQQNLVYHDNSVGKVARINDQAIGTNWPFDNNEYYYPGPTPFGHNRVSKTLDQWRAETGFDIHSTLSQGTPPDSVRIFPNEFDEDRAFIVAYNWTGQPNILADLSSVINHGETYALYHIYGLDAPVISGTYDGGLTVIPTGDVTAPEPEGDYNRELPVMPHTVGVYLLVKNISSVPTPDPPTPPPIPDPDPPIPDPEPDPDPPTPDPDPPTPDPDPVDECEWEFVAIHKPTGRRVNILNELMNLISSSNTGPTILPISHGTKTLAHEYYPDDD